MNDKSSCNDFCWCVVWRGGEGRESVVKVFLSRVRAQQYLDGRNAIHRASHGTTCEPYLLVGYEFDAVENE